MESTMPDKFIEYTTNYEPDDVKRLEKRVDDTEHRQFYLWLLVDFLLVCELGSWML